MKHFITLSIIIIFSLSVYAQNNNSVRKAFDLAQKQLALALKENFDSTKIPRAIDKNGKVVKVGIQDWTSGFFAGSLWLIYEYTKEEKWKLAAEKWTSALEKIKYYTDHHDVGFMLGSSYGNGCRLTGNKQYKEVLIQGAKSLATRFNTKTGCIKSWNYRKAWDGKTEWFYPVIIDNMMNLELLLYAAAESGDTTLKNIAVTHALTTLKNHYRTDYSCYHVVNYDTLTGKAINKATCQGFTDESSWARGQAWGLYGYTMCYRKTGKKEFLAQAENIASYILNNPKIPADAVPFWDYDCNNKLLKPEWKYDAEKYKTQPRDASAAAITASALYELSCYSENGKVYREYADKIISTLLTPEYLAAEGENGNFILKHSVGSLPHGSEIDVPLSYADYYFLEALLRKNKLEKGEKLF